MRGVWAGDIPVLLVNLEGRICAYLDRCPHLGVRLSEGSLHGTVLTCRAHRWQYDIATGRGINPESVSLEPLEVSCRDGKLLVSIGRIPDA